MQELAGRTAVVTGAGSGIGLGLARTFAREGMAVALLDYRAATLEPAARQVRDLGARALAIEVDVSDRAALERAASEIEAAFGNVHILCNNAGVLVFGKPVFEVTGDEWDWIVGVNLRGAINGAEIFLPRILRHGEPAHVVNTSSIGGFQVNPELQTGAYAVTKFGVVALSEALANDLAGTNVGVSVLAPAAVNTGIYNSAAVRPGAEDPAKADPTPDRLKAGLSGDAIGRRVVRAIRDGDFYIFTHIETRAWLEARHKRIIDAYAATERWAAGESDCTRASEGSKHRNDPYVRPPARRQRDLARDCRRSLLPQRFSYARHYQRQAQPGHLRAAVFGARIRVAGRPETDRRVRGGRPGSRARYRRHSSRTGGDRVRAALRSVGE